MNDSALPAVEETPVHTEKDLIDAVYRQGLLLDAVASVSRRAKLSGNPGVSTLGAEILALVERAL